MLLALCEPLTTPASTLASKIDPTYVLSTHRLHFAEDTKLCATTDDVMYWLDPRNPDLRDRYLARMAEAVVTFDPEGVAPLPVSTTFGTVSLALPFFLSCHTPFFPICHTPCSSLLGLRVLFPHDASASHWDAHFILHL